MFLAAPETATLVLSDIVPLDLHASMIAAGDFNGDGFTDLVSPDHEGAGLAVSQGNGDGTFVGPNHVGQGSLALAGDMDGDGDDEVLTWRSDATQVVSTLIDDPLGAYTSVSITTIMGSPLALLDLNGDGRAEIVFADFSTPVVSLSIATSSTP